jgi:hypothetical protein
LASLVTTHRSESIYNSVQQSLAGQPIPDDKRFWYIDNGFGDPTTKHHRLTSGKNRHCHSYLGPYTTTLPSYYLIRFFQERGPSHFTEYGMRGRIFMLWAGWEVTREGFFQNQRIFDFLKLKASTVF